MISVTLPVYLYQSKPFGWRVLQGSSPSSISFNRSAAARTCLIALEKLAPSRERWASSITSFLYTEARFWWRHLRRCARALLEATTSRPPLGLQTCKHKRTNRRRDENIDYLDHNYVIRTTTVDWLSTEMHFMAKEWYANNWHKPRDRWDWNAF